LLREFKSFYISDQVWPLRVPLLFSFLWIIVKSKLLVECPVWRINRLWRL